jgi:hypothetical protein
MARFTFKIEGGAKWYGATIEDGHKSIEALTFSRGTAEHDVPDSQPAWLTVHARGDSGVEVIVSILRGKQPHIKKRTYTIPAEGSIVRAIQFDPTNPTVKAKDGA